MNTRCNARLVYSMGLTLVLCHPARANYRAKTGTSVRTRATVVGAAAMVPVVQRLEVSRSDIGLTSALPGLFAPPIQKSALEPVPYAPEVSLPIQGAQSGELAPTAMETIQARSQALQKPNASPELELHKLYENPGDASGLSLPSADGAHEISGKNRNGLSRHSPSNAASVSKDIPPLPGEDAAGMKKRGGSGQATAGRDVRLINQLLGHAAVIREQLGRDYAEKTEKLAMAIHAGRFRDARAALAVLAGAGILAKDRDTFDRARYAIESKIPGSDHPAAKALTQAVKELMGTLVGDPFQIQARLSRLIEGILPANIPKPIERVQEKLARKSSWLARERGTGRKGPETFPIQRHKDCWLRSIYDLPVKALEPLRGAVTYEEFLDKTDAWRPGLQIKRHGLSVEDFPALMEDMGLKTTLHPVDGDSLERLLTEQGAVIAVMGWFGEGAEKLSEGDAWMKYRQHVVIILRVEGTPGAREFVVRDSALGSETRYTAEELGLLQTYVYTVEPAGKANAKKLAAFLK